eukprot:636515-Prymnesium_polylepis.2
MGGRQIVSVARCLDQRGAAQGPHFGRAAGGSKNKRQVGHSSPLEAWTRSCLAGPGASSCARHQRRRSPQTAMAAAHANRSCCASARHGCSTAGPC